LTRTRPRPAVEPQEPATTIRQLRADELLSFEQLKSRTLYEMMSCRGEGDVAPFIGKDWLETTCDDFVLRMKAADDDSRIDDGRIRPGAVIGCSRSGKSRALRELGETLRVREADVIYVSFNDATFLRKVELRTAKALQSFLARVAFAIATDEVRQEISKPSTPLHDASGSLRITITQEVFLDWLGHNACVVLIDEINNCVDPLEGDPQDGSEILIEFLRTHFAGVRGRYYAVTTHRSSTVAIEELFKFPTTRTIRPFPLPTVETIDDLKRLLGAGIVPRFHEAWYGGSPGLIVSDLDGSLEARWQRAWRAWSKKETDLRLRVFDIILQDLFEPGKSEEELASLSWLEQFTRVLSPPGSQTPPTRCWPPVSLSFVLGKSLLSLPPSADRSIVQSAKDMIDSLNAQKLRSGRCWEVAVMSSVFCRVAYLRSTAAPSILADLKVEVAGKKAQSILPDGVVKILESDQRPQSSEEPLLHLEVVETRKVEVDDALDEMRTFKPRKTPALCLVDTIHDSHELYDAYLVFYPKVEVASAQDAMEDESNMEAVGLQMKAGKALPDKPPHRDVQKSFHLRGADIDPGISAATRSGWIVVSEARRNRILTPSFSQLIDLESDAKEVEQTADDTAAAAS